MPKCNYRKVETSKPKFISMSVCKYTHTYECIFYMYICLFIYSNAVINSNKVNEENMKGQP